MSKLFILVLLALTHRKVFAAVTCNLCENEKCYWQNGTYYESYAKTCQQKDVDDAYRSLNAAYRQNYSLPTVVDGNYDCLDIVTIFDLNDNNVERFTFKGCVQQGFQARNILPNAAFIKQERRDKFVVCNTNQCNIPFLDGNAFRCNTCNGTEECLKKNLNYVYCESDIPRTYKMLSNHYQKTYQPQYRTKEYECLSINSTLQGSKNSSLVFRGCVEKGFESCNLSFNKDLYKSEDKSICKKCDYQLCNKDENKFKCYYCKGEDDCKKENLDTVTCENNVGTTYSELSNYYMIYFGPENTKKDYECFTINSTLTGKKKSQLTYKGCIEKNFKACSLNFEKTYYKKETKQHCKICSEENCNKNSSSSVTTSFILISMSFLIGRFTLC